MTIEADDPLYDCVAQVAYLFPGSGKERARSGPKPFQPRNSGHTGTRTGAAASSGRGVATCVTVGNVFFVFVSPLQHLWRAHPRESLSSHDCVSRPCLSLPVSIDAASRIRPRWPNLIDSPSAPWMRPGGLRCRWRKSTYYFSPLGPHPGTIVRLNGTTSAPAVGLLGGPLRLPFAVRSPARLPHKCGIFACARVFADDTTGSCVRGPRKGQS